MFRPTRHRCFIARLRRRLFGVEGGDSSLANTTGKVPSRGTAMGSTTARTSEEESSLPSFGTLTSLIESSVSERERAAIRSAKAAERRRIMKGVEAISAADAASVAPAGRSPPAPANSGRGKLVSAEWIDNTSDNPNSNRAYTPAIPSIVLTCAVTAVNTRAITAEAGCEEAAASSSSTAGSGGGDSHSSSSSSAETAHFGVSVVRQLEIPPVTDFGSHPIIEFSSTHVEANRPRYECAGPSGQPMEGLQMGVNGDDDVNHYDDDDVSEALDRRLASAVVLLGERDPAEVEGPFTYLTPMLEDLQSQLPAMGMFAVATRESRDRDAAPNYTNEVIRRVVDGLQQQNKHHHHRDNNTINDTHHDNTHQNLATDATTTASFVATALHGPHGPFAVGVHSNAPQLRDSGLQYLGPRLRVCANKGTAVNAADGTTAADDDAGKSRSSRAARQRARAAAKLQGAHGNTNNSGSNIDSSSNNPTAATQSSSDDTSASVKPSPCVIVPIQPLKVDTTVELDYHHVDPSRPSTTPALLVRHQTEIDVAPWLAQHVVGSIGGGVRVGDDENHAEGRGQLERVMAAVEETIAAMPPSSEKAAVAYAIDCTNIHSYVAQQIVPSIVECARRMRDTHHYNQQQQHQQTPAGHDVSSPHSSPPVDPSVDATIPLSPALVEWVSMVVQSMYPVVLRCTLLAENIQYGRNYASDARHEGREGEGTLPASLTSRFAASNSVDAITSTTAAPSSSSSAFRHIRPERSRIKAVLLRDDPVPKGGDAAPPATTPPPMAQQQHGDDEMPQLPPPQHVPVEQQADDAHRLILEDHSTAQAANYYKSRIASLASAMPTTIVTTSSSSSSSSRAAGGGGGADVRNSVHSTQQHHQKKLRAAALGFSTEVGPMLEAYRTLQRVASERDFAIASAARAWVWREALRRVLVFDLHNQVLEQRLLSAAILLGEMQTSSNAGSVLTEAPLMTVDKAAACLGPDDVGQMAQSASQIAVDTNARSVTSVRSTGLHLLQQQQIGGTANGNTNQNNRAAGKGKRTTTHRPTFTASIADLARSPPFNTPRTLSISGLPYGGVTNASMAPFATIPPLSAPGAEDGNTTAASAIAASALAPPPELPPMVFDNDGMLMPSQRPRPYPNAFADRVRGMEVARQLAAEAAEEEWRRMMATQRHRRERERMEVERAVLGRVGRASPRLSKTKGSAGGFDVEAAYAEHKRRRQMSAAAATAGVEGFSVEDSYDVGGNSSGITNAAKSVPTGSGSGSGAAGGLLSSIFSSAPTPNKDGAEGVLTDDVMEALATLETLDALQHSAGVSEEAEEDPFHPRALASSSSVVGYGGVVSGDAPPANSMLSSSGSTSSSSSSPSHAQSPASLAAWRWTVNADPDFTYYRLMEEAKTYLAAAKVEGIQRRMMRRAMREHQQQQPATSTTAATGRIAGDDGATVAGGDAAAAAAAVSPPSPHHHEELRALREAVATDPSVLDAAMGTLATPKQISKAVTNLIAMEKRRREGIVQRLVKAKEEDELKMIGRLSGLDHHHHHQHSHQHHHRQEASCAAAEGKAGDAVNSAHTKDMPMVGGAEANADDGAAATGGESYFSFIRKRKAAAAARRKEEDSQRRAAAASLGLDLEEFDALFGPSSSSPASGVGGADSSDDTTILSEFRDRLLKGSHVGGGGGGGLLGDTPLFAVDELGLHYAPTAAVAPPSGNKDGHANGGVPTTTTPSSSSSPQRSVSLDYASSPAVMAAFGGGGGGSSSASASSLPTSTTAHQIDAFEKAFDHVARCFSSKNQQQQQPHHPSYSPPDERK